MALRTPPSWLQNGSHPAENDRLTTKAIWKTTGIVNATDLQLQQTSTGAMSVTITPGWAAIVGTSATTQGTYMAYNDANTIVSITAANPSNPRIDLICVTVSDAYYSGSLNQVAFNVVAGTPAGSPTAPATPANSIALGQVAVGAGVTSILTANITNYGTLATTPFSLTPNTAVTALEEVGSVVASAAAGTVNIDCVTSTLWYYTTAASANWTLNFRGNSTTTLNSIMSTGNTLSVVFLNTSGATAYYPSAFTIDGTSVTPKWSGGTAPSAGNASAIDAYSFTIIKTAANTYTVLAGGAVKFA